MTRRDLVVPALAVVAVAVLAFLWQGERTGRLAAEGKNEAAEAVAAGLTVELKATRSELAQKVRAMVADSPALGVEVAKVRRVAPSAKPVEAATVSTGPIVAHGDARLQGPPAASPSSGTGTEPPEATIAPRSGSCLLSEGDAAELRHGVITLRSDLGNAFVVGEAEAWRLSPGSPTRILVGTFSAPLSNALELKPPEPLEWAIGLAAACARAGCSVGLALGLPPLRVWGGQFEASVGVPFLGAQVSAHADILWRR